VECKSGRAVLSVVSESPRDYGSCSNEKVEQVRAPREVTDVEVEERIEKFALACKSGVKGIAAQYPRY